MNKEYFIKLTFAVYQTTEKWPDKNLLKIKTRNLANEILSDFILFFQKNPKDNGLYSKILKEINEIQDTFFQARTEKFLGRGEFLLLKQEYNNIKGGLEVFDIFEEPKEIKKEKPVFIKKKVSKKGLNQRQKKILDVLKEKEKVQVQDLQEFFPKVTKRTLRRDLDGLLKTDFIKRKGEWSKVFYVLNNKSLRDD